MTELSDLVISKAQAQRILEKDAIIIKPRHLKLPYETYYVEALSYTKNRVGGTPITHIRFRTFAAAFAWAHWNYKHRVDSFGIRRLGANMLPPMKEEDK